LLTAWQGYSADELVRSADAAPIGAAVVADLLRDVHSRDPQREPI